mgnify:CR=1 FL=1
MDLERIRAFRTILRRLERDVAVRQKRDDRTGGLSVVQCHTVISIGELGSTTVSQMAERMGVDKSTLSRTLDGLVDKNLVQRLPDPRDRRFSVIRLTPPGQSVCEALNRVNDAFIKRVFERIPGQEHQSIMTALKRFVEAMEKENGER